MMVSYTANGEVFDASKPRIQLAKKNIALFRSGTRRHTLRSSAGIDVRTERFYTAHVSIELLR